MDQNLNSTRNEIPVPEDGVAFPKLLKRCADCMNCRVRLMHPHKPTLDDTLAYFTAHESITEVYCRKGRIRFSNGHEKSYRRKYAVTMQPTFDADCPDFDPDE